MIKSITNKVSEFLMEEIDRAYEAGWCDALNFHDSPEAEVLAEQLKQNAEIVDRIFSKKDDGYDSYVQP